MKHLLALSKADSNHHKQNQNLLCYHYTIGHCGCKGNAFWANGQIFGLLFSARSELADDGEAVAHGQDDALHAGIAGHEVVELLYAARLAVVVVGAVYHVSVP